MKKISLFILSVFAVGVTLAQAVSDFDFVPTTTDNNMSVVFPAGTLNDFVGGSLMAFKTDGAPVSAASPVAEDGSGGIAAIGTDAMCGCDYLSGGDQLVFAILLDGEIIVITDVDPPLTYSANTFEMISGSLDFTIDGAPVVSGCADSDYLEYQGANLDDGSCATFIVEGCMDAAACNLDAAANVDDGSCTYAEEGYDCDGNCLNDADGDLVCDEDEVAGCDDETAFNYNALATDNDGSCEAVLVDCMNPAADNYNAAANTPDNDLCEYSGINAWGAGGGSEEAPTYITSNNMSVLFPVENLGVWEGVEMVEGDVIFAVYETARLENELVGYSAVSGIQSAGAVTWTGAQVGMPVFGSDNNLDNGFQEFESLVWLVERADGVVYNANVTTATAGFDGNYEDGEFVIISSVSIGAPLYDGCMDASVPNFDPLATNDDGSCQEAYSIGCMDADKVNFAGAGANPTHDNAENFGDAFGQNLGLNLLTGETSLSGAAANVSDDSMCQDQVEGCTDAMAINYDPIATQNDATICDWSLNGMELYDVDENGNILATDYNFGAVAPDNENDGILGSDFDNANILFQAGALDVDAHVIANLASVMEWVDADEIADAQELADTITDMQARYDANDLWWNTRYDDTLAAVAVWFAEDEAADAQELADTIHDMQARYDANDLWWNTLYDATVVTYDSMLSVTNDTLDYHRAPIEIDLHTQWNTVAYYLHHESPVVAQFENQFGSETAIANNINIVKNNEGLFYWPEFNFDGIQMLQPGQGYQVRVKDSSNGKSDFIFEHAINADAYRTLNPTVPAWAIDMPVDVHPNDVRSLVRVVNMLGQEVIPAEQFKGEVLLYMFNDGTVEKKMVK